MKKFNLIVIFDQKKKHVLMCKRAKEPYKGLYNFVGGKIEKENDGLNEAYRELEEETNIKREDTKLIHFMDLTYVKWNWQLEVYYGILNKYVNIKEEVNTLAWMDINENLFDKTKFAGEGNTGHIFEEIKVDMEGRKIV